MSAEFGLPAIRFDGFSGEWVSSSLGQLLDITSAARVHKEEWTETGVPFFRTSDVVSIYKGQENKKAYISFKLYEELSAKVGIVRKDDLLITGGGSIGIPFLIKNNEPLYFKDADLLWLKNTSNTNGYLLYTFFSSPLFRKYIFSISHIGTISHYTIEQAKSTPIQISNDSEEQTKIGHYFQQLDTLIAKHQQKHDKLLNLKKALLEKMFPKQGATTPEIRFKGFSEEWEEKALGDVINFINGRAYSQGELLNKGKYPVLRVGNFYTNSSWYYSDLELGEKYYANNGDLLYTWSASFGPHIWTGEKVIYHYHIWKLLLTPKIVRSFLLHVLNKDRDNILSGSNGSTMIHITKEGMEKKTILITEQEEQNKIGGILDNLDSLISQHQAQLKKLSNIKQACLEKMFV